MTTTATFIAADPRTIASQIGQWTVMSISGGRVIAPVSYTHLDVYKRQPLQRPVGSTGWPAPCSRVLRRWRVDRALSRGASCRQGLEARLVDAALAVEAVVNLDRERLTEVDPEGDLPLDLAPRKHLRAGLQLDTVRRVKDALRLPCLLYTSRCV